MDILDIGLSEALNEQRYDWVHPSWRDVVIEYLMSHPADRRRFLSRCGVPGLELALSVSGGRAGERRLPLLVSPEDWTAVRVRAAQLIPQVCPSEQEQLLGVARGLSVHVASDPVRREHANQLQGELLQALAAAWDVRSEPIRQQSLRLFYEVSVEATPLVAGPQVKVSLEHHTKAFVGELTGVTSTTILSTLEFALLVASNEPRALRQFGWPKRFEHAWPLLIESGRRALRRGSESLREIDGSEVVEDDDAAHWSYEAHIWRRVLEHLRKLGICDEGGMEQELRAVEVALDRWLEDQEERADRRGQRVDDATGFDDDEDPTELFDIQAVLSDL